MANLLQFAPDESIQTVLSIPNYEVAKYLVLATRSGKVKKTRWPSTIPRARAA